VPTRAHGGLPSVSIWASYTGEPRPRRGGGRGPCWAARGACRCWLAACSSSSRAPRGGQAKPSRAPTTAPAISAPAQLHCRTTTTARWQGRAPRRAGAACRRRRCRPAACSSSSGGPCGSGAGANSGARRPSFGLGPFEGTDEGKNWGGDAGPRHFKQQAAFNPPPRCCCCCWCFWQRGGRGGSAVYNPAAQRLDFFTAHREAAYVGL